MLYTGSCHCGRIRFEVEGEVDSGLACNCSMCSRKGSLLWFVPRDNHLISKVAGLLHVTHGEYIAAKLHAREDAA